MRPYNQKVHSCRQSLPFFLVPYRVSPSEAKVEQVSENYCVLLVSTEQDNCLKWIEMKRLANSKNENLHRLITCARLDHPYSVHNTSLYCALSYDQNKWYCKLCRFIFSAVTTLERDEVDMACHDSSNKVLHITNLKRFGTEQNCQRIILHLLLNISISLSLESRYHENKIQLSKSLSLESCYHENKI